LKVVKINRVPSGQSSYSLFRLFCRKKYRFIHNAERHRRASQLISAFIFSRLDYCMLFWVLFQHHCTSAAGAEHSHNVMSRSWDRHGVICPAHMQQRPPASSRYIRTCSTNVCHHRLLHYL